MSDPTPESWPELLAGNPGVGAGGRVNLSRGNERWSEEIDLVALLTVTLERFGHTVERGRDGLEVPETGFTILPRLVDIVILDDGGYRTVSTVQTHHRAMLPTGLFEYQHSAADTIAESFRRGLEQWAQTDFVTLLEATSPRSQECTSMVLEMPAANGRPARARRAVLGPVTYFAANPVPVAPDDPHPFCGCCLLTNTFRAFEDMLKGEGVFGLRLYAARTPDGTAQADCRVNGLDHEPGAEALRQYVRTWPGTGFEFRKQYVVLSDHHGSPAGEAGDPSEFTA